MLADKLVELEIVPSISHETVRKTLKKTNWSHTYKRMLIGIHYRRCENQAEATLHTCAILTDWYTLKGCLMAGRSKYETVPNRRQHIKVTFDLLFSIDYWQFPLDMVHYFFRETLLEAHPSPNRIASKLTLGVNSSAQDEGMWVRSGWRIEN